MTTHHELRSRLLQFDALPEVRSDGPFIAETFVIDEVFFELTSEYGNPRLNIGVGGRPLYPASFWLAALEASTEFPDPPVSEEDLQGVTAKLQELVKRAPELEASVELLGDAYSAAMRERLE